MLRVATTTWENRPDMPILPSPKRTKERTSSYPSAKRSDAHRHNVFRLSTNVHVPRASANASILLWQTTDWRPLVLYRWIVLGRMDSRLLPGAFDGCRSQLKVSPRTRRPYRLLGAAFVSWAVWGSPALHGQDLHRDSLLADRWPTGDRLCLRHVNIERAGRRTQHAIALKFFNSTFGFTKRNERPSASSQPEDLEFGGVVSHGDRTGRGDESDQCDRRAIVRDDENQKHKKRDKNVRRHPHPNPGFP